METKQDSEETHSLESADIGTGENIETERGSDGDLLPGEGRRRDLSGHGKKARQRAELTR